MRFDQSSISGVVFSSSLFENNVGTNIGGALSLNDATVDLIHNCTFLCATGLTEPFLLQIGLM